MSTSHEFISFKILLQENEQLIEEKQATLLDLVTKMVKGSKNTEFLISLRCTEVTDKDTIKKLLMILLENVDFKVSLCKRFEKTNFYWIFIKE